MRSLSHSEFANSLKECFLSVWVDNESGFGTFPLESMACGIPVIGKIPDLVPEWMNENNGIWTQDKNKMVDLVAEFIQNWLEDSITPDLFLEIEKTTETYQNEEKFKTTTIGTFSGYLENRIKAFEEQLNKI
jgi:glycosyltransferase involved in cell wall biosynthesis